MEYEPTIGLEIHAELKTKTKMFCDSLNDPDEKHPNVNVCPVCMAHPGTLPVINEEAVQKIIKIGLALNCRIAEFSKFDRKNYFYPDIPKGYQISQYDLPLCADGTLLAGDRSVRIERIHLEEDTGRLIHPEDTDQYEAGYTLVDYNRAGVPLMELVTRPDITSSDQIEKFARELQLILRYSEVSDADMEKGQMRVEVNISLKPKGSAEYGTKVEIKNINSINAAVRAAEYEIKRQTEVLEMGDRVIQETRGWDETKQETFSQRIKETSADYRYFPEPDLPPMRFPKEQIETIAASMPELPSQRRERFVKEYGLNNSQVEIFTTARHLGDYFEHVASELDTQDKNVYSLAANYIITEFPPLFQMKGMEIDDVQGLHIEPESFAELILMLNDKKLSSTTAKQVLKEMATTGLHAEQIVEEKNLGQVSDTREIQKVAEDVVAQNSKAVEDYKKGKTETLKFLVGKVMAASRGKANPEVTADILKKILD